MKLILVRHGESIYNKGKIIQGQKDVPLSDVGVKQAEDVAMRLEKYILPASSISIYSSDLKRAYQTALPFVRRLIEAKCGFKFTFQKGFREISLGPVWEGKPLSSFYENLKSDGIPQFELWINRPKELLPTGAEPFSEFKKRVFETLYTVLSSEFKKGTEWVIVFTHGGVISLIANLCLNYLSGTTRFIVHNTSAYVFDYHENDTHQRKELTRLGIL